MQKERNNNCDLFLYTCSAKRSRWYFTWTQSCNSIIFEQISYTSEIMNFKLEYCLSSFLCCCSLLILWLYCLSFRVAFYIQILNAFFKENNFLFRLVKLVFWRFLILHLKMRKLYKYFDCQRLGTGSLSIDL